MVKRGHCVIMKTRVQILSTHIKKPTPGLESRLKSTDCSSEGPKFESQHLQDSLQLNCPNSSFRTSNSLFWTPQVLHACGIQMYTQAKTSRCRDLKKKKIQASLVQISAFRGREDASGQATSASSRAQGTLSSI